MIVSDDTVRHRISAKRLMKAIIGIPMEKAREVPRPFPNQANG
jgi:hypothetical protein